MTRSLRDWLRAGWLSEHQPSREEISDLLGVADRDLGDCQSSGLSPDWRLAIAYNAAMQLAVAALAAAGYRASREGHHYRVIQSLAPGVCPAVVGQARAPRPPRESTTAGRNGFFRSGGTWGLELRDRPANQHLGDVRACTYHPVYARLDPVPRATHWARSVAKSVRAVGCIHLEDATLLTNRLLS